MGSVDDQVARLTRGCEKVFSEEELRAKLSEGRPLRVKLGVDPTAPDIHLGHSVVLSKLRDFQDLGHEAILIIGDFTAMIGDPSGRSVTRPQLTHRQVLHNATSYQEQAFKILSRERSRVVFNGEWFQTMQFEEVIKLNSRVTLQQMLVREDFRDRLDQGHPIRAHEIQYPIMQGWDSVMIKADVELGGTDQLFNIMVGRDLQRDEGMPQQVAMVMPILEGLDGRQKMSKSLENYVALNESPSEMFGKLMSIGDELMPRYFEVLLREDVPDGEHPMDSKKSLARRVTARFHSVEEADIALKEFELRFSRRDLGNANLPLFSPEGQGCDLVNIVVEAYARCFEIIKSRSEARRLIEGGSVQWDGEKIVDPKATLSPGSRGVLKLDKTRAVRIP
ncbi:MAG TPA: tyrosine--tRNA ligase [Terrimicrobiaceae bacterium]|nr:tyrosine--tRNA ligase [Terrimicrobiaceae bacterium]